MEGGKKMKLKMIIKSIFVTVLSLILVALAVIAFMKIDKTDDLYSLTGKKDYRILYKVETSTIKPDWLDIFKNFHNKELVDYVN